MVKINRFDVCLINLDPTVGSEIKKTRPCVVVSPNSMNHSRLRTLIIAPMTSTIHAHFPTRVEVVFQKRKGEIALDQLRIVDKKRIIKVLGFLEKKTANQALSILQTMFR